MRVPAPGAHGGDADAVAAALGIDRSALVDLSMSLNPFAPDVESMARRSLGGLARYPDQASGERAVAAAIGVDADRLVLTNGGSEAIALVAQLHPVGAIEEPEFSLYRRHLVDVRPGAPRWRSNPSNPMGRLADLDDPSVVGSPAELAVWDEAFHPLATGRWSAPELEDHAVWRLGSLTKLWSCPGLRLGYAIAPDADEADRLRARRPRWSVNGLALAMLDDLLAATDLPAWSASIRRARVGFRDRLRSVGATVIDTDVNWVLVEESAGLRERLIPHGVLVRDATSFAMPTTVRVAIPAEHQIDLVVDAFAEVMGADK